MFDAIMAIFTKLGVLGVFLLMVAENIFPPIPSEVILPLAGYGAAQRQQPLALIILAGTLGSTAGATAWYYAGRWLGLERLKRFASRRGRWLTLTPQEVDDVGHWFQRHGRPAVLLGRMLPGVRTLISVPAGVTAMPLLPFLLYTLVGSTIWTSVLVIAGYQLGSQYERVSAFVEPASNTILGLAVA